MLSKTNRLAKDRDIKKVFAQGRSFFNPFFQLKHLQSSGPLRLAVVVSTKVSKKATVRNRLKRIIRETLRPKIKFLPPGDYILMLKPKAAQVPEKELLSSLKQFLKI